MKKKALLLRFLKSLLITYLITLSLEKEIIVLEKSPEKFLIFLPKKFVRTLALGTGFMYFLQILIGSLNCLRL